MEMDLHRTVSHIRTPKEYIEEKSGIQYPKIEFMRSIANKFYPGWSWTSDYTVEKDEHTKNTFFIVKGVLTWKENGKTRYGTAMAAHRLNKSRLTIEDIKQGVTPRMTDPSNDIKAANTDALKKAFNMYMNICDDIYRARDPEVPKEIIEDLLMFAKNNLTGEKKEKQTKLLESALSEHSYLVNTKNVKERRRKLEILAGV